MLKYPAAASAILVQGSAGSRIQEYYRARAYFRAQRAAALRRPPASKELEAVQANMVNQFSKFGLP